MNDLFNTEEELDRIYLEQGVCRICGRRLTNPESVANGIGPVCGGGTGHGSLSLTESEKMSGKRKVNYAIIDDQPEFLVIQDLGPWDQYLTVTNGAEIVVDELAPRLGDRKLYYKDSDLQIDQILVQNGEFAGFSPGGPKAVKFANKAERE